MTTLTNLVAFGTIMIGNANKSVSIYSNKAFGELNMHNVDLYIDVYGNKVKVKSLLFNNLNELVSIN